MLKIFVAGSSSNLRRCEDVIWELRRFAIVTCDWPAKIREKLDAGISDADLTDDEARFFAAEDERGVDECDCLLWLSEGSVGASWEASRANAQGKPVFVSGSLHALYGRRLPDDCKFANDADAIAALADMAVRHMRRSA